MKNERPLWQRVLLSLPLLLLVSTQSVYAVTPEEFAGSDGLLNEKELIEYLLVHDNISYQDVWEERPNAQEIAKEGGDLEQAKKKRSVRWRLLEIRESANSSGPYTPQQVLMGKGGKGEQAKDKYTKKGLIGEPLLSKDGTMQYGPIRLRQKVEDWNKDIVVTGLGGASVSYAHDRIEKTGTWQSQGSLIYPIEYVGEGVNYAGDLKFALLPSVTWDYYSVDSSSRADTEDLTFRIPVYCTFMHDIQHNEDTPSDAGLMYWRSEFYFSPYYLTDFDFDGAMVGLELNYEPILGISQFHTGSWVKLLKESDIAYLFRIIPGLTYGRVLEESPYINREENDDILALTTSLEVRFKLFGKSSPWEIYGTYDLWYDFNEETDEYSDILKIGSTWWFNEHIGMDIKYQKGDTILTNREIDLVTLNLQFIL